MSSIEVSRTISFDPASQIIDFLGTGYSSKGVAQASLSSLSPMYPSSSIVWLSNLLRKTSPRTERAGDTPVDIDEFAFKVVMFKRINHNLPDGLSAESLSALFGSLFSFANAEEKALKHTLIADLIANPYYSILAITVPTFSAGDPKTLSHYIVGAALFTHDNKNGTFVSTIGIADKGDPLVCSLSAKFFVDPSHAKRLLPTSSFRGKDLATFLLSTLQVLGHLGFKAPHVSPSEPFHLD
jgi:hypothetical protein